MEQDEKLNRKVETLRGIYGSKGIDLNEDEAKALAHHSGSNPLRAAILCCLIILALVAFLIVRFVL